MKLGEYQKLAHSTAGYPNKYGEIYPKLGLIGEIGELAEKVKKMLRDDNGILTEERNLSMRKETGDICWYFAEICTIRGIDLEQMDIDYNKIQELYCLENCIFNLSDICTAILNKFPCYEDNLKQFVINLQDICLMLSTTLEDVLQENIDKLLSRKERGVICGDGDNR